MTPVYEVAIAGCRTNISSVNPYAARLDLSVFFANKESRNNDFLPVKNHLFPCCSHNVKKYAFQRFHSVINKTTENFPRVKRQHVTRNDFDGTIHHLYSNEVTNLTHCNVVKSGKDVLWQQAKFELLAKNSESNALRGYIKEQLADFTTTATNEEK